jgi:Lipase (class 3)
MISDLELAWLCGALYQEPSPVAWDKEYASPLFGHAALFVKGGVKYLVRRGSKDPMDWYRDFVALPREFPPLGTYVHPGIVAGVLWTFKEIEADLAGGPYVVAGHSLGGGEGVVLGGLMTARGHAPEAVVAFEPPRVAFKSLCDPATMRTYKNLQDWVPDVPDLSIPFLGHYVIEKPFIELDGPPSPLDQGKFRFHHITCVIEGLEKIAPAGSAKP